MVEAHDFKDRSHGLIIEPLPVRDVLDSRGNLIKTQLDLLNVFKIAIVFASQPLELLLK